jgi:hypothetical protein
LVFVDEGLQHGGLGEVRYKKAAVAESPFLGEVGENEPLAVSEKACRNTISSLVLPSLFVHNALHNPYVGNPLPRDASSRRGSPLAKRR